MAKEPKTSAATPQATAAVAQTRELPDAAEGRFAVEPLDPGPVGRVFEVDDFDSTQQTHWGRVDLDQRAVLLRDGHDPSTSDPLFHQQMVYAVCSTVYAAFRRALGRRPALLEDARRSDHSRGERL